MKQYAVRNLALCTKDCLCLFVCPVGATDTENSIIDTTKCVGCGACARACPSGAIVLLPWEYPAPQEKTPAVAAAMRQLAQSKADQEQLAAGLARETDRDGLYRLMRAIAQSLRLLGADVLREAGYLLPQGEQTREKLTELAREPGLPGASAQRLLELLQSPPPKP